MAVVAASTLPCFSMRLAHVPLLTRGSHISFSPLNVSARFRPLKVQHSHECMVGVKGFGLGKGILVTLVIGCSNIASQKTGTATMDEAEHVAVRLSLAAWLGVASILATSTAEAAQEVAYIAADNDSRGLIILVVLIPALAWVLFNILQPALSQINRMRSSKGLIAAVGLSASALFLSPDAEAAVQELTLFADNDSTGLLILSALVPAIGWVLFNILQPDVNQIKKMTTAKGVTVSGALGPGLYSAGLVDASVQELPTVTDNDASFLT